MPRCTPTDSALHRIAVLPLLGAFLVASEGPVDFFIHTGADAGSWATAPLRWSGGDWAVAGTVGLGIAAAGIAWDQKMADSYLASRTRSRDTVAEFLDPLGTHEAVAGLAALWLTTVVAEVPGTAAFARDAISGILIEAVVVTGAKQISGRTRPKRVESDHWDPFGGHQSFPSGHAAQGFVIATVAVRTWDDQPWVALPAYALATGVAWSRLAKDAHYVSDVLAGAVIGTTIGWTVSGRSDERRAVQPVASLDRAGVVWRF